MTEPSQSVAIVRKRPGLYVGDTGQYGLSHLIYFLLDAAVAEARGGTLQQMSLCLGEDGSVEFLDDGQPVPLEILPDLLTRLEMNPAVGAYEPLRFETLCVFALSEHFELEAWDETRRWRLMGRAGVLQERPSPEPLQGFVPPTPQGTRVRFIPDRTLFQPGVMFDVRRMHLRCRELAGLTPGLSVHFRSARLQEQLQYPRGLADLVDELTQAQLVQLETPLACEAQWEDFGVRCALQWTVGPDCRVWSFANTVRTRKGGRHVEGLLDALGVAMAQVRRHKRPWPPKRLLPGLTLIVAVDGPNSRVSFAGPTKDLLATEGLREGVASVLAPVLERALRERMDAGALRVP
jgi:DNA gyrase subunit B